MFCHLKTMYLRKEFLFICLGFIGHPEFQDFPFTWSGKFSEKPRPWLLTSHLLSFYRDVTNSSDLKKLVFHVTNSLFNWVCLSILIQYYISSEIYIVTIFSYSFIIPLIPPLLLILPIFAVLTNLILSFVISFSLMIVMVDFGFCFFEYF